jgi:hypothetical protein
MLYGSCKFWEKKGGSFRPAPTVFAWVDGPERIQPATFSLKIRPLDFCGALFEARPNRTVNDHPKYL